MVPGGHEGVGGRRRLRGAPDILVEDPQSAPADSWTYIEHGGTQPHNNTQQPSTQQPDNSNKQQFDWLVRNIQQSNSRSTTLQAGGTNSIVSNPLKNNLFLANSPQQQQQNISSSQQPKPNFFHTLRNEKTQKIVNSNHCETKLETSTTENQLLPNSKGSPKVSSYNGDSKKSNSSDNLLQQLLCNNSSGKRSPKSDDGSKKSPKVGSDSNSKKNSKFGNSPKVGNSDHNKKSLGNHTPPRPRSKKLSSLVSPVIKNGEIVGGNGHKARFGGSGDVVAGGGAGEGEEVMDNGLPEELVKLLQDSPAECEKIPGCSYAKGAAGLLVNPVSIILETSKQESSDDIYNEKFNRKSFIKGSNPEKAESQPAKYKEEQSLCPGSWFTCPQERGCGSLSWKMCFFCLCLPSCYTCYLTRTIRRRHQHQLEKETKKLKTEAGSLIAQAQDNLSTQGSTSSPASFRKGGTKETWTDVDVIFTCSPLSNKVIREIEQHKDFKHCDKKVRRNILKSVAASVPEQNGGRTKMAAILETCTQEEDGSPVILRRDAIPVQTNKNLHQKNPSMSPNSLFPNTPRSLSPSEKYFSLESVIESQPTSTVSPGSPVSAVSPGSPLTPSSPSSPSSPGAGDEIRFFSLPTSNNIPASNEYMSASRLGKKNQYASTASTSGSSRYISAAESLTSGRYTSAAGSLLSGSSRYFSAADTLSNGSVPVLSAAKSLTVGFGPFTKAAQGMTSDLGPFMSGGGEGLTSQTKSLDPSDLGYYGDRFVERGKRTEVWSNGTTDTSDTSTLPQTHKLNGQSYHSESQFRCELSDRLGGLSLPHDGGLSHHQDGGLSRPRRDIDNCDNTLRLPVPHLLSHLDGQQVHEICQRTDSAGSNPSPYNASRLPRFKIQDDNNIQTIQEDYDHNDHPSLESSETPTITRGTQHSPWFPIKIGSVQRKVENHSLRLNIFKEKCDGRTKKTPFFSDDVPSIHVVVVVYSDVKELNLALDKTEGIVPYLDEYWRGYYPLFLIRINQEKKRRKFMSMKDIVQQAKAVEDVPDVTEVEEEEDGEREEEVDHGDLFSSLHRVVVQEDVDVDFVLDSLSRYFLHRTVFQCGGEEEDSVVLRPPGYDCAVLRPPSWTCPGLCRLASRSTNPTNNKQQPAVKKGFFKSVRKTIQLRRLASGENKENKEGRENKDSQAKITDDPQLTDSQYIKVDNETDVITIEDIINTNDDKGLEEEEDLKENKDIKRQNSIGKETKI